MAASVFTTIECPLVPFAPVAPTAPVAPLIPLVHVAHCTLPHVHTPVPVLHEYSKYKTPLCTRPLIIDVPAAPVAHLAPVAPTAPVNPLSPLVHVAPCTLPHVHIPVPVLHEYSKYKTPLCTRPLIIDVPAAQVAHFAPVTPSIPFAQVAHFGPIGHISPVAHFAPSLPLHTTVSKRDISHTLYVLLSLLSI